MKRITLILALVLVTQGLFAQYNQIYRNERLVIALNLTGPANTNKITKRAYTAATVDTTQTINIGDFNSAWLALQSADSAKLLIKYAVSVNDSAYTPYATLDSLDVTNDAGGFKTLNISTTAGGAHYVKFIFAGSAAARPEGTTSAYYWAAILLKKY